MSSSCGNCDCADKSRCGKGNNYGATIVETQKKGYMETVVMDASAVEHGQRRRGKEGRNLTDENEFPADANWCKTM
ncbi:metallothionein [Trifolium repens]|nr:metallothionein [Trifolium repens]